MGLPVLKSVRRGESGWETSAPVNPQLEYTDGDRKGGQVPNRAGLLVRSMAAYGKSKAPADSAWTGRKEEMKRSLVAAWCACIYA
jgi:hypothetical protein